MEYATTDHLTKEKAQEQGSFYTPKELSIQMAKMLNIQNKPDLKVLDPCVGKGNLLLAVKDVYSFVKNENLYGVDIDKEAIEYCKAKFPGGHFKVGNALEDPIGEDWWWEEKKPTFNISKFGRI